MRPFVYDAFPAHVIFGTGTLSQVPAEMKRLGCSKALILTTPGRVNERKALQVTLGDLVVDVYSKATMHTPTNVTRDAVAYAQQVNADCLIAIGGGSTIGLSKAIALYTDLPQIVIPTTYSGSEATSALGQTENGVKTVQKTLKVLAEVVIYDVSLTMKLSSHVTVCSGINAIAHAVEALYGNNASPITDHYAQEGIRSIAEALPILVKDGMDPEARSNALYGAWLCGMCGATSGSGLHHMLCHLLGGTFDLPHAETHTVILPYAIAYNASFAAPAIERVRLSLGVSNAAQGLHNLIKSLGVPYSLKELGMRKEDLERAAEIAAESRVANPAPLEKEKLLCLLEDAWEGKRPA